MAEYPLMKYWQAPDGTVYEVCDKEARRLAEEGGGGDAVDEAAIEEAVAEALEQAKASGEFDGADGKDGVSPTISVSVISGGHRLTIKDANGTKTVDLLDGSDGSPGATGETGATGVGIKNIVFKQTTTAGNVYTINLTDGSSYDFTAPAGPKGADGSGGTGGGGSGEDGVGIQSIQLKSEADTGNTYTIILTDGSTYDFVAPAGPSGKDGSNGSNGEPGKDGTSVTVASVTESTEDGGSNVVKFSDGKSVTIKNGSKGSDGEPGENGTDGKDGVSPTVSVSAITGGNRLTIKDANGTRTVDVMNGTDGQDGSPGAAGKDGTSVTVTNVSESDVDGGTNVVTFSDGKKLNIKNGSKGDDGAPGDAGPAGRGVQSMTYNSSTNKWTVTFTDGTSTQVDGPAIPDVSGYMPKSGGTFTGAIYAMNGVGTAAQLRNTAQVTTETYPDVDGQINWLCE